MKPPLTKEGCKSLAFYSISACIILAVLLSIIWIWDLASSETGFRLMYSMFVILGGVLIFTVVNVLFIFSDQEDDAEEEEPEKSTISRALRKAKLGDDDAQQG